MTKDSYSVYVDKRPTKQLYVFNKTKVKIEDVDQIITYNSRKWAGRFNYVLIANSNKLSEEQWGFLKIYDPDFVKLCIHASRETLLDFDRKITPLQATSGYRGNHFIPNQEQEGLSIIPTPENIHRVSGAWREEVYIVLFDVSECDDNLVKEFVQRNFGTLDLANINNKLLIEYPYKTELKVNDKGSLITALSSLNDHRSYVFPLQLCSLDDNISQIIDRNHDQDFYFFVGNTVHDLIDYWNNPINLPQWLRTYCRQLWLPNEYAVDPEMVECLKEFISRRITVTSGSGHSRLIIKSRSVENAELERIVSGFSKGLYHRVEADFNDIQEVPQLQDFFSFDRLKHGMDHIRSSGKEERISIVAPDINEGVMGGEVWMNDLYVEFPETKVVYSNLDSWLQLPRNNSVAHTVVKKTPSRINKDGLPSVLTSRTNRFTRDTQTIYLSIPKRWNIFASIILNVHKHFFTNDLRSKHAKHYELSIKPSRDGRNLNGLLDLFGDLDTLYQVFEERHWREFFELLANVSRKKEVNKLKTIENKLKKKIPSVNPKTFPTDALVDWLATIIMNTAQEYSAVLPKTASIIDLEQIARSAVNEVNERNPGSDFEYSRDDVISALNYLTEMGVIMVGYDLKCPSCLYKEWRSLEDTSQFIVCRGCGYEYSFSLEQSFRYKLNTMLEAGVRTKGLVPVVLALGVLYFEARNYFEFLPPVDIYRKDRRVTDLDICCIVDGKFIIGEVKANQKLLAPSDIDKILFVAKKIRPDTVVFSTMDRQADLTKNTKEKVDKVRAELEPLGIEVKWLSFGESVYQYSLVR